MSTATNEPVATTKPPLTRAPARTRPMTTGWPGKTIGRVGMSSWSLANVMHDPENETAPTSTVKATARADQGEFECDSSSSATSAAAPPPTPLNRATSCGI